MGQPALSLPAQRPAVCRLSTGPNPALVGRVSFYEGTDIAGEFRRIDATGWRKGG